MTSPRRKKGYIWRKPHTRTTRSGSIVHIPGMWVKSVRTSHYDWAKKRRASLAKSHAISRRRYGVRSCPKGMISRAGYVRKRYTRSSPARSFTGSASRSSPYGRKRARISVRRTVVPYTCILDRGLPGKGPRMVSGRLASIGPVKKGTLSKYGYSLHGSAKSRHRAIRKGIKAVGRNTVMRKINNLSVWFKNTNKGYAAIAKRDKNWIRKNFPLIR